MYVTFENSGYKQNNAVVWNVCLSDIQVGVIEKIIVQNTQIWRYCFLLEVDKLLKQDFTKQYTLTSEKVSSLKEEVKHTFETVEIPSKLRKYILFQKSGIPQIIKKLEKEKSEQEQRISFKEDDISSYTHSNEFKFGFIQGINVALSLLQEKSESFK